MTKLCCRGKEAREKIVQDYHLKVLVYAKLLNGQTKTSCTNNLVEDRYYQFLCIKKDNENIQETIVCGTRAGKHFIELAKLPQPTFFNPCIGIANDEENGFRNRDERVRNEIGENPPTKRIKWDPLALELYNAINLLLITWRKTPSGILLKYKEDLEKYSSYQPFPAKIEKVNDIIGKDFKKRTLTQMIEEHRANGNNMRDYQFPLMNEILEHLGEKSNL